MFSSSFSIVIFFFAFEILHETTAYLMKKPVEKILIHLEDDEHLIIPKHSNTIVSVRGPNTKSHIFDTRVFEFESLKINKKPMKYPMHNHIHDKFKPSFEVELDDLKKCCGSNIYHEKEVEEKDSPHQHRRPKRPLSLRVSASEGLNENHVKEVEDIKPVTEYIEDDLKYDFRTKTHSI